MKGLSTMEGNTIVGLTRVPDSYKERGKKKGQGGKRRVVQDSKIDVSSYSLKGVSTARKG